MKKHNRTTVTNPIKHTGSDGVTRSVTTWPWRRKNKKDGTQSLVFGINYHPDWYKRLLMREA